MTRTPAYVMDYYDAEVTSAIAAKYGLDTMEALRRFVGSKTYSMLANPELEMWDFGPGALLDMWEVEQVTGSPRDSLYLRGDEYVSEG